MRDPSAAAARLLRVLLAAAVTAILAGLLLGRPALRLIGLWLIVAGPFAVLVTVSAGKPRTRWFAAGTLILAVIGLLLAR